MVATNPVHPDLRRNVQKATDDDAEIKIEPSGGTRDGVIKVMEGILHTHMMDNYEIVGTSVSSRHTLVHVERE